MNKPIYFGLSVWGRQHRNYLLDYCLPSLLSPNNLPSLKRKKKNKFIICTPDEDRALIESHPIIQDIQEHIDILFLEIPTCPKEKSSCLHMGIGHTLAIKKMCQDKVYGCIITPDQFFADGCISFMEQKIEQGYDTILTPACFRTSTDKLFPAIHCSHKKNTSGNTSSSKALIVSKNDLVRIISQSIHSSFKAYEWRAKNYNSFIVCIYRKLYNKSQFSGFLYYTLSWAPIILDYEKIDPNTTAILKTESLDANYIGKNISNFSNLYFSTSSKEFISTSWSRPDEYLCSIKNSLPLRLFKTLYCIHVISLSYHSNVFDDFKRNHFKKPIIYYSERQLDNAFIQKTKKIITKTNLLLHIVTSKYFYYICKFNATVIFSILSFISFCKKEYFIKKVYLQKLWYIIKICLSRLIHIKKY